MLPLAKLAAGGVSVRGFSSIVLAGVIGLGFGSVAEASGAASEPPGIIRSLVGKHYSGCVTVNNKPCSTLVEVDVRLDDDAQSVVFDGLPIQILTDAEGKFFAETTVGRMTLSQSAPDSILFTGTYGNSNFVVAGSNLTVHLNWMNGKSVATYRLAQNGEQRPEPVSAPGADVPTTLSKTKPGDLYDLPYGGLELWVGRNFCLFYGACAATTVRMSASGDGISLLQSDRRFHFRQLADGSLEVDQAVSGGMWSNHKPVERTATGLAFQTDFGRYSLDIGADKLLFRQILSDGKTEARIDFTARDEPVGDSRFLKDAEKRDRKFAKNATILPPALRAAVDRLAADAARPGFAERIASARAQRVADTKRRELEVRIAQERAAEEQRRAALAEQRAEAARRAEKKANGGGGGFGRILGGALEGFAGGAQGGDMTGAIAGGIAGAVGGGMGMEAQDVYAAMEEGAADVVADKKELADIASVARSSSKQRGADSASEATRDEIEAKDSTSQSKTAYAWCHYFDGRNPQTEYVSAIAAVPGRIGPQLNVGWTRFLGQQGYLNEQRSEWYDGLPPLEPMCATYLTRKDAEWARTQELKPKGETRHVEADYFPTKD